MASIVVAPNQVLREPTKPVKVVDQRLLTIIDDLVTALKTASRPQGVGLAAPQIGVSLRLFAIRPNPGDTPQIFINPDIISKSMRQQSPVAKNGVYEGCLSLPHFYSPLKRAMSVTVKYQALSGSDTPDGRAQRSDTEFEHARQVLPTLVTKTETFTGFPAHVIQHEMDHLNGVLFPKRVLEQKGKLYKSEKNEKGEDVFEEIEI